MIELKVHALYPLIYDMKKSLLLLVNYLFISHVLLAQQPPVPEQRPYSYRLHGDSISDPYRWVHQKDDRDVLNYISAENGYTERMLRATKLFQGKLVEEMRARYPQKNQTLPHKEGNYYYYSRQDKDSNYGAYYRRKGSMEGEEELLLDLNQLAKGNSFIALSGVATSPSQEWLAYAIDYSGSEEPQLSLRNIRTGIPYHRTWEKVDNFVWANDNKTIFYTVYDSTHRPYRLYKHQVDGMRPDELVYTSKDKFLSIQRSQSDQYIILQEGGLAESQLFYIAANTPNQDFQPLTELRKGVEYGLIHPPKDKYFYFLQEEKGIRKVYRTKRNDIAPESWEELWAPSSKKEELVDIRIYKDYMAFLIRENGMYRLQVTHREKPEEFDLSFGEKPYQISIFGGPEDWENNIMRFSYTSYTTPDQIIDYNLETRQQQIIKQDKVLGQDGASYNPDDYVSKRVWATSRDGTKIPISIVYKKGMKKDGSNPFYLSGYGSYGAVYDAGFSYNRLSLLNRGFIVGQAHIRGSGYLGNEWYEAGKMMQKKNSVYDFIDASKFLIEEGFTSEEKLIAMGGSAGGMLMGAVVNEAPELYKAVIASVPAMDLIDMLSDTTHYGAKYHHGEWGNPLDSLHHYQYLKTYSPYQNIKEQDYPAMMVIAGFEDARVLYHEPVKFVMRMREKKTDNNPLLLHTIMAGGHGLGSGQFSGLKSTAMEYAFIFKMLGISSDYALVSGIVKDKDGEPLPFSNVIIDGTSSGTTTNEHGEYALALRKGQYTLRFQFVGFETQTEAIDLQDDRELDVTLPTESVLMKAITITDKYNDPAYGIIKNAQDKRKDHRRPVDGFKASGYMKMVNRFDEIPDKIPAFIPKESIPDSTDLGLIYLSESQAIISREYPDEVKEEMISSKVAGSSQGYSWNRIMSLNLDFYENLVTMEGMSERGFVSPIARNALLFYRYEYMGEVNMHGQKVNKIKVIPRRRNDPTFSGYIYIAEDSWHIAALDLGLQNQHINFFDTLSIKQEYIPMKMDDKEVFMPLSANLYAHLRLFGFGVSVTAMRSFADYELNPEFEKGHFNNEVFYIHKTANQRDSNYWQLNRPMILTEEEAGYYNKGDSLEIREQSKEYVDSVMRIRKKFKAIDLLGGYYFYNPYSKQGIRTNSLLEALGFNTVEGVSASLEFAYLKGSWDERSFNWTSKLRYGFSNRRLNATTALSWSLNRHKWEYLGMEGGRYTSQFNNHEPISTLINTAYSLLRRENFMKLYGKNYGQLNYGRELVNGVYLSTSLRYEDREPLSNTNNFALVSEKEDRRYTPNIPNGQAASFTPHQALIWQAALRLTFDQKYATLPNRKQNLGSKYPVITLSYRKGIPVLGSDVDFDFAKINIGHNLSLGLLGESALDIAVGGFLRRNDVPFIDFQHFNGNQTAFLNYNEQVGGSRVALSNFQLLDYYAHSTNNWYIEAHYEHRFNGFLVNKLPLLRRTKFQMVGAVNYLWKENLQHLELSVGVENIFKVIRVDWVNGYSNENKLQSALRLRVGF